MKKTSKNIRVYETDRGVVITDDNNRIFVRGSEPNAPGYILIPEGSKNEVINTNRVYEPGERVGVGDDRPSDLTIMPLYQIGDYKYPNLFDMYFYFGSPVVKQVHVLPKEKFEHYLDLYRAERRDYKEALAIQEQALDLYGANGNQVSKKIRKRLKKIKEPSLEEVVEDHLSRL